MIGVNINDSEVPYTGLILAGLKTLETRRTNSLKSHAGERVALVRTGVGQAAVVGLVTLGAPWVCRTRAMWRRYRYCHRVPLGSRHDWDGRPRYMYAVIGAWPCEPVPVASRGIVTRVIPDDVIRGLVRRRKRGKKA